MGLFRKLSKKQVKHHTGLRFKSRKPSLQRSLERLEARLALSTTPGIELIGDELVICGSDGDDIIEVVQNGTELIAFVDTLGDPQMFNTMDVNSVSVSAGDGDDSVNIETLSDIFGSLFGEAGNDVITGGGADDLLDGGLGIDLLRGRAGDDLLIGGEGDDQLYGLLGDDELYGDGGADVLYGNAGADFLSGGDGNDLLVGEAGEDDMTGGEATTGCWVAATATLWRVGRRTTSSWVVPATIWFR